jgi:hypothetical protein
MNDITKIEGILDNTIIGFKRLSRLKRNELARAFKETRYNEGKVLIEEKCLISEANLLIEGHCKVYLKNNPRAGKNLERPEAGSTPF